MRSCELGEYRLVQTCLELGADVNRRSLHNNGMTPLHFACKSGNASVTRLLLDRGAETRLTVQDYCLPISYCLVSMSFACADLVLCHEAELEAQGRRLPPLTREMEQYNNIDFIREGVTKFRATGDYIGQDVPVCDMRSDKNAIIYEEQAQARTKEKTLGDKDQCAACGVYSKGLRKCTACQMAKYCNASKFQHF